MADRYLLERELGHGGMATVYLARDLWHDRPVALKVLHPQLAQTLGPEQLDRPNQARGDRSHRESQQRREQGQQGTGSPDCGSSEPSSSPRG